MQCDLELLLARAAAARMARLAERSWPFALNADDELRALDAMQESAERHGLVRSGRGYAMPPLAQRPRQITASDERAIAAAQAKRERRAAKRRAQA